MPEDKKKPGFDSQRERQPRFDFLEDVFQHDQGREPRLAKLKHERMARDPFHFFRGSVASFHRLWRSLHPATFAPTGWVCGDPHWENVGSYRAKNRIAYFDLTDFDHCCLAPVDVDVGRALTSYYVTESAKLAPLFLSAYRETLLSGKPQHIEREVAKGQISVLLEQVRKRRRKRFLEEWTKEGRIRIREDETFRLSRAETREALRGFGAWSKERKHPGFYRVLSISGSLSGVGSLGLRRYLVLVAGGDRPHLIDMKEAAPSAVAQQQGTPQPRWRCEAERVATIQRYVQYVPIAHLGWAKTLGTSFVLRDFQPQEDRIDSLSLRAGEREAFAGTMGKMLAWAHLRTASWKAADGIDDLIQYAQRLGAIHGTALIHAASAAGRACERAFKEFRSLVAAAR